MDSSSLSSSSAPISEHSRLHKLTLLWTILRTHPRCIKTKVMGPKVELYCTEPCPPWSTCPASPIRWRTIDGCSKNALVVLWWVGSRKMSEHTKSSLCDNWGDLFYASVLRDGLLLINRPRRDGRLSWQSWLTDSGWRNHKVVTRPASSLAQDRESSPAETSVLPTMLRRQRCMYVGICMYVPS